MAKKELQALVEEQKILNRIYVVRGQKIMLDKDLAELYRVETRVLKQAVKRNKERFPMDFMFEMTGRLTYLIVLTVIPAELRFQPAGFSRPTTQFYSSTSL